MGSVPWLCFAWTARIMVPRLGLTKMLWGCYPRCSAGKRNAIDGHASGVDHGGVAPPPPEGGEGVPPESSDRERFRTGGCS